MWFFLFIFVKNYKQMKKILFLLLLAVAGYGQTSTGQETEFDYGIKNNSTQTITTPTYLTTTGNDGTQGKIPSAYIAKTADVADSLSTKENISNKSDSYTVSSSTTYASTKALVDGLDLKLDKSNTEGARLDPTFTDIYGWGDSLTNGGAETPYTTYLNGLTNFTITNRGVGGETSTQIKNRMIAETGAYSKSVIIWAGRNNLLDPATVKADIATMIAALGHTRYIVVSILNGVDEPVGNSVYNAIISLNNDLKAIYGEKYVDVRGYLVGLFPNPQDVIDESLRSDNLHLNSLGYQRTAEYFNTKLGILFNQTQYLQSKDFKYYLNNYDAIIGSGSIGTIPFFTGTNTLESTVDVTFNASTNSVGLGSLPIDTGDGSSWFATGAPFANAFGGGLISSIAGINGAYFYSSQNYAIVRAGINYLSSPMGVKLQVNDVDDAFILESNSNAILKRNTSGGVPNSLLISNTNTGASGIQLSNSSLASNNKWQFFISNDTPPIFKIGQDNIGDYLSIASGGATTFSSTLSATSYTGDATLTGTPTAPTATAGTNTTQIATTAFVSDGLSTKIGGTGTTNYIPKFTGGGALGNSSIFDNGVVGLGTNSPVSESTLTVKESAVNPFAMALDNRNSTEYWRFFVDTNTIDDGIFGIASSVGSAKLVIHPSTGNVGIATTTDNTVDKLQVNGTMSATSYTGDATLTGTPTAPTATAGTNTTQIATTAFVQTATNAIGLQQVLNTDGYADIDSGNSVIQMFEGTANNRRFIASMDNGTIGSRVSVYNDKSELSSYNSTLTGVVKAENGLVKLIQYSSGLNTSIEVSAPTVNSTVNFPAPPIAGTYTVAYNETVKPYKVYVALLSQTGTNAPVATVLENTLGGTVTYSYTAVGSYNVNLTGAFTSNKTVFVFNNNYEKFTSYTNSGTLSIITKNGGSNANDLMSNLYTSIEIRVYP